MAISTRRRSPVYVCERGLRPVPSPDAGHASARRPHRAVWRLHPGDRIPAGGERPRSEMVTFLSSVSRGTA